MKVKLHKGPAHGKTVYIPDGRSQWQVVVAPKMKPVFAEGYVSPEEFHIRNATYQMKMMSGHINGKHYYCPCIHPDGSVFFEYVK
jgi:hypothetical protein